MKAIFIKKFFMILITTFAFSPQSDAFENTNLSLKEELEKSLKREAALALLYQSVGLSVGQKFQLSVQSKTVKRFPNSPREIQNIVLSGPQGTEHLDNINIKVSLPINWQSLGPLPVLMALGGGHLGTEMIKYYVKPKNNIIVTYDYPYLNKDPLQFIQEAPLQSLRSIPMQVAGVLKWIQQQTWSEDFKINLFGVSAGGFFLPAAQRVSALNGASINASVLAYTGTNLNSYVTEEIKKVGIPVDSNLVEQILKVALFGLEPSSHLEALSGKFLIVAAINDDIFTPDSNRELTELTPYPKEFIWVQGGHINTGSEKLIQNLQKIVFQWLEGINAINP